MRAIHTFIISSFLLLIGTTNPLQAQVSDTVTITRIVDGDTFWAHSAMQGRDVKYRPIGINTPELANFGKPEQPFAREATNYMKSLIKKGDRVIVIYDVQKLDRYNRDLVYAHTMSGLFINAELVRAGWAQVATYPPNIMHVDTYVQLQKEAREEGRGMW